MRKCASGIEGRGDPGTATNERLHQVEVRRRLSEDPAAVVRYAAVRSDKDFGEVFGEFIGPLYIIIL